MGISGFASINVEVLIAQAYIIDMSAALNKPLFVCQISSSFESPSFVLCTQSCHKSNYCGWKICQQDL